MNTAQKNHFSWFLVQLAVAFAGGYLFYCIGIPSAWMLGAMASTIVWCMTGKGQSMPNWLRNTSFLISGVAMGQTMSPEALVAIKLYPFSLLILMTGVVVTTVLSTLWLQKRGNWKMVDAFLASVPGGLGAIVAIASESKRNIANIVMVQSFRLFALTAILPVCVALTNEGASVALPGAGKPVLSLYHFILVYSGGFVTGFVLERLKVAAGYLIGGLCSSLILHVTGFTNGVTPAPIALAGLILVGTYIGLRFGQLQWRSILKMLPIASGSFLLQFSIAGLLSIPAALVADVSFSDALLAFAPGGQEVMSMLALTLGLNPLFVITHHLVRFLSITLTLNFWILWLERIDNRNAKQVSENHASSNDCE